MTYHDLRLDALDYDGPGTDPLSLVSKIRCGKNMMDLMTSLVLEHRRVRHPSSVIAVEAATIAMPDRAYALDRRGNVLIFITDDGKRSPG